MVFLLDSSKLLNIFGYDKIDKYVSNESLSIQESNYIRWHKNWNWNEQVINYRN